MKKLLILFFLLNCFVFKVIGQTNESSNYEFAKRTFKSEYKKQSFEKYDGVIKIINESTFKFGEKTLTIINTDNSLLKIFKKGIFNPDIVFGAGTSKPLTQNQIDTMSTNEKVFYNMVRNDSLNISSVKELVKLNPNYKTKRFVFWLFNPGRLNPTEYYFELYNDNANYKSSLNEFLENAKMTFFYKGTIII
ncbi:hypothetical protein [Pedobacter frigiditerrae]|uniref:hypothetical protein n=1 Tax=Pedobacter frigiditerrae TaxID=2530452 RepID=UPI002930252C|nr:hypothetical protein [Pedobacter frigiditerrae]